MKEEILNILNMNDIINKYGIKMQKRMCHCPLHKDNTPSMRIYEKSFYCFSCNRTGDLIQFVQYLFNIDFKTAMNKINDDFNLNLSNKVNKKELERIKFIYEQEKLRKIKAKKEYNYKMQKACNRYRIYNNLINKYKQDINYKNWEDLEETILFLEKELEKLDEYMEKIKVGC